jgi:hypothetical protein
MSSPPGRAAIPRSAILLAILLTMACGGGKGGVDGGRADGSVELPDGRGPGADGGRPGADGGQPGHPGADGGHPGADGGQRDADGGHPGADGGQHDADGGHPGADGGQPGPVDAGAASDAGPPAADYCLPVCTSPADCNFGSAPHDSDNYDCRSDVCVYTGCNDDAECRTLGNYLCRPVPGSDVPFCLPACATPADCNLGSPPYSADNYECQNNACVYTGCNDDAECRALGNYLCRASPGFVVPFCQPACTTPADCNQGSPPYDSDNYECLNDVCVYAGCNDDAECRALGNYVCSSGG